MKAKEVMQILRISNPTLSSYVKRGLIKTTTMPNGRYNYDEESVYAFLNSEVPRKVYIYAMVPSPNHKSNLHEQVDIVKQFCFNSGGTNQWYFSRYHFRANPELRILQVI